MSEWAWPQYTYFTLVILNFIIVAIMHGKPKTGNFNVLASSASMAFVIYILYAGGFFK